MPRVPTSVLIEQAQEMQERCPELYAHLRQRDAELQRILRRIPSPADIALSGSFDLPSQIRALRKALDGGLNSFSDSKATEFS